MGNGINWVDWTAIAIYSVALLGIALYHSRKMKKQDDMFLAGRSMSRWPIAISMYMALFSTNTFLGSTGWVNRPNGTIWICLQTFGIVAAVPLIVYAVPHSLFPPAYHLGLRISGQAFQPPGAHGGDGVLPGVPADVDVHYFVFRVAGAFDMLGWTAANGMPNGRFGRLSRSACWPPVSRCWAACTR